MFPFPSKHLIPFASVDKRLLKTVPCWICHCSVTALAAGQANIVRQGRNREILSLILSNTIPFSSRRMSFEDVVKAMLAFSDTSVSFSLIFLRKSTNMAQCRQSTHLSIFILRGKKNINSYLLFI